MKIVFFGTDDFVVSILESLAKAFDVVAVVTTPDAVLGRKKTLTPSPVKLAAEKLGIQTIYTPEMLDIKNWQAEIPTHDLLVVASYGKLIPQAILDVPRFGGLNVHPSALPKYRGPSPIPTTILNGETETAVTIIKMDSELDHGPILTMKPAPVRPIDTFLTLAYRLFGQGAEILPEVITDYASEMLKPKEQNHSQATFTKHLTKDDGYFDITNPPIKDTLDHMIRAYYPWPGVWTKMQMANGSSQIVKFFPENKIQVEGKNSMTIKDFLNGYPEMKKILTKVLEIG